MNDNNNLFSSWKGWHSKVSIIYITILLFAILIYFNVRAVHPIWFIISFSVVIVYFYILQYCTINWMKYDYRKFEKKLFWHSLFYRVITSIILITVAELTWGIPDHVGAVDALTYHKEALIVADFFRSFDFSGAYRTAISFTGYVDNSGPPLLLGFVFAFFGKNYFIGTIFLALLGSFSVVLTYRIGALFWNEDVGRTSGLILMHFPLALFYSVVIMKEGVVVFLVLLITYLVTKSINGLKLTIFNFLVLVLSVASLYYFRLAVGVLITFLVPTAFLINKYRGNPIKSWAIGISSFCAFGFLIYSIGELDFFLSKISEAWIVGDQREEYIGIQNVNILDLSFREILLSPIYIIMAIITPFAGIVEVGTRHGTSHDHNYYNIAGILIWNIFTYFSIIGIYHSIKERFSNGFMVWGFTGGYLFILTVTVLFTRVRFAYIGMPLLFILAAVGLQKSKNNLYWYAYLGIIAIGTIVWNILRLQVRGL